MCNLDCVGLMIEQFLPIRLRIGIMTVCDSRRKENYQEYLRLLENSDYYDVTYDERSAGVSAIHKEHRFDKTAGPFGYRREYYERYVLSVFRSAGHCIVLDREVSYAYKEKSCDGFLDGERLEIKSIEGEGRWAVRTKIEMAYKQRADVIALYFPTPDLFSLSRIITGWNDFLETRQEPVRSFRILAICENRIVEIEKPPR